MFDQLFQEPKTLKRQLNAPLLEDRLRYLTYRAEQGTQRLMLREIARYQVIAVKYLGLDHNDRIITIKELEAATKCWLHHEMLRFGFKDFSCSTRRDRFIPHIRNWLKFLGRIEIPEPPISWQLAEYVDYMRKEKGLSEATICTRRYVLQQFFSKTKESLEQFFDHLIPAHLDAILIKELRQGVYTRHTIKNQVSILRNFLRYAEHRNWCRCGITDSIQAPRVYKHETLPSGISLEEIQRLLKTTEGENSLDIRDRAIILLLAIYGFRASEVRKLCLEDINWKEGTFRLRHSKRGPIQQFPLSQTVGDALVEYLTKARPKSVSHGEIFLTIRAPFRPLKGLASLIYARWRQLGVDIKHHGTHSLRHACATRLINQGVSLKTIADQLGHRDLETTRVYTKVDLSRLREVGNFNLGGVL